MKLQFFGLNFVNDAWLLYANLPFTEEEDDAYTNNSNVEKNVRVLEPILAAFETLPDVFQAWPFSEILDWFIFGIPKVVAGEGAPLMVDELLVEVLRWFEGNGEGDGGEFDGEKLLLLLLLGDGKPSTEVELGLGETNTECATLLLLLLLGDGKPSTEVELGLGGTKTDGSRLELGLGESKTEDAKLLLLLLLGEDKPSAEGEIGLGDCDDVHVFCGVQLQRFIDKALW